MTTADLILTLLVRAHLAASAAILIVLLLRPLARRLLGPEIAYALWTLVPIAALTSLFPSLNEWRSTISFGPTQSQGVSPLLVSVFLVGAGLTLGLFLLSEMRFRRLARQKRVGPAVMGMSWPEMVVPADYHDRYSEAERNLIRAHERTHIDAGHTRHNRVIALMQVLGWFNPLVHLAARCARLDQEMACDAVVIERQPKKRRLYAETLLKAQSSDPWSALACALADGGRHPLEIRIQALGRPPLTLRQYLIGGGVIGACGLVTALAVFWLSPTFYYLP